MHRISDPANGPNLFVPASIILMFKSPEMGIIAK